MKANYLVLILMCSTLIACGGDGGDVNDIDKDGVPDQLDIFPNNPAESKDNDLDGIGDNADNDDDNDGVIDSNDAFPLDPKENLDTDGDGIGNNADTDDDNDGVDDSTDAFPLDASEFEDHDKDGIGNKADLDDDDDGFNDDIDSFPLDSAQALDADGDGVGDETDLDDDNDGVEDIYDAFPLDKSEQRDFDLDGIGDNSDSDDDNDGIVDTQDYFDVVGVQKQYEQGYFVIFSLRGFSSEQQQLNPLNGWHSQYYVYDVETGRRLSSLITEGYYNANYNNRREAWEIEFPTHMDPKSYRVEFSVYCSLATYDCDGVPNNDYTVNQSHEFSVYCSASSTDCTIELEPHKATQLTNSINTQDSPTIVSDSLGALYIAYRDFADLGVTKLAISQDNGASWAELAEMPSLYNEQIAVSADNQIIALDNCNFTICLYQRVDAVRRTYRTLAPLLVELNINKSDYQDEEGVVYPFSNLFFQRMKDGNYLIGFSLLKGASNYNSDLYLVKTADFIETLGIYKINREDGINYGLSVAESDDGQLLITYAHLDSNYEFTWNVLQGSDFSSLQTYGQSTETIGNLKAININNQLKLIGVVNGSIHEINLAESESEIGKQLYNSGVNLGFSSVTLDNGELLIAYPADWNNQRDIFVDKIGNQASQ
ncbi:thrombospondin type 3 repeat-containing protein [Thalassotalea montiporae]